jgi:gliding motility-associated lipoprotein GldD
MKTITNLLLPIIILLFSACGNGNPIPKPKGYMRVSFPERVYIPFKGDCPYSFEFPSYVELVHLTDTTQYCNKNLVFTPFDGTLHLTYKKLENNVARFIDECHGMAYDHTIKAKSIERKQFVNDSTRVFGLLYDIQGNAASPLQFYVTDSNNHFIRGALYFNARPNYDSIRPVLDFVREDVIHFIESVHWK